MSFLKRPYFEIVFKKNLACCRLIITFLVFALKRAYDENLLSKIKKMSTKTDLDKAEEERKHRIRGE